MLFGGSGLTNQGLELRPPIHLYIVGQNFIAKSPPCRLNHDANAHYGLDK